MASLETPVLQLDNLRVHYRMRGTTILALADASLRVDVGQAVGIVGESGSGKSTLARASLGLLPTPAASIASGRICIVGRDVTALSQSGWTAMRGNPVAMVFQDPLSALNPVMRIGKQIAESVRRHDPDSDTTQRVTELLELVNLPPDCARAYAYELSGGMRQRALLAIALGCRPALLIADEPTTALDVTTQAGILALLDTLRKRLGMAILYISHDLAAVASLCESVNVMYAGFTIESGATSEIFTRPAHPYTHGLLLAARTEKNANGRFATIAGTVPDSSTHIAGCPFAPRCANRVEQCDVVMPEATPASGVGHTVRCWNPVVRHPVVEVRKFGHAGRDGDDGRTP
jgi:oligopeptide/dipeptide ABC transporter ATP-binding protein